MPVLNGYTTGRLIGEGSFGKVWVVKDSQNNEFALKQLRENPDGLTQEFLREVSVLTMLNRLNGDNFVRMVDTFIIGDSTNIIFELYDCDLAKYMVDNRREMCDRLKVRDFFKQIMTAVDILHANNIIHRDLKPQNILVDQRDKQRVRLRIADFGLARNYSLHTTFTSVTVTLWYRAPEVILQCQYTTAIDIWACACILAEMSNLRPLFSADTEIKMARQIFQKLGSMPFSQWPSDAIAEWHNFSGYEPCNWQRMLPNLPLSGIKLTRDMLCYLPHIRPVASEILQHEYLA